MHPQDPSHQAPVPVWRPKPDGVEAEATDDATISCLRQRIADLEQTVSDYEALLNELPEVFERKFQQRLEPLLERYRLLARAQQLLDSTAPGLIDESPDHERSPSLFRWRSDQRRSKQQPDVDAAA